MHRLVWGIIIVAWGLLCFAMAGHDPKAPPGSSVIGLLVLAGGGTMIFFGARYLSRRRAVMECALQMLRADEKINAYELAQRLGISEIEVRKHVAYSQRKGIIPFRAEIT